MVWENPWNTSEIAVSHCILSVWPSFRQCAVSSFTPSTFLLSKGPCCASCFSEATCTNASCTASASGISCCKEEQVNRGNFDGSTTILEILQPRNMSQGKTAAPKRACGRFWWKQKELPSAPACLPARVSVRRLLCLAAATASLSPLPPSILTASVRYHLASYLCPPPLSPFPQQVVQVGSGPRFCYVTEPLRSRRRRSRLECRHRPSRRRRRHHRHRPVTTTAAEPRPAQLACARGGARWPAAPAPAAPRHGYLTTCTVPTSWFQ